MARTLLALLVACACCGISAYSLTNNVGGKPFNFLFRLCRRQIGNEAISRCLKTYLSTGLALVRPFFSTGLPAGGGAVVVLDPLTLDDVSDAVNTPPRWVVSGLKVTGLKGAHIEKLQVTESTVELEMSLEFLIAEAQLYVWFLPLRPHVQVAVRRPRVIVTADWQYVGGDLVFSNSEKIVFLNDGYTINLKGIDVPAPGQRNAPWPAVGGLSVAA